MITRIGIVSIAWLAALPLATVGVGYAVAQEDGESTVELVQIEPVGEPRNDAPESPSAQLKAAEAAVESAAASCGAQSEAMSTAKRNGDIIMATCLEDKLEQCNANLLNMKRRETALGEALANGDTGAANHEARVISVLSQKFKMLEQAANQCVGQDLFETGETRTTTEVDLFAPDANPAVITPVPDWPIPFIPPPLSGVN